MVELPPVVVTANPLGSELFELVPPVSVLDGRELFLRREATLGETLDRLPGVSSTTFGPNASRPVIRGLDGDRVRLLQNGVGVSDASALSFDHAVSVDPLLVERVEVVAARRRCLYGGTAIGGWTIRWTTHSPSAREGVGGRAEARFAARPLSAAARRCWRRQCPRALHADGYTRRTDDLASRPCGDLAAARRGGGRNSCWSGRRQPTVPRSTAAALVSPPMGLRPGRRLLGPFDSDNCTVAEEAVRNDMRSRLRDVGRLEEPQPPCPG